MDDLIGRTLKGTFLITARLGEGAMGTVYRGVETSTQRDVAIKIMHPALMQEPGMLTRFRREATAMRRVQHPNAVAVYAHGVDQGIVFLAMELVSGSDLGERLAKGERMTVESAVKIVADVCSALAEAHAHGLVHRDIKPENIMLGGASGQTAKLIDFGIAKSGVALGDGDEAGSDGSIDDSIPDSVDLGNGFDLTTTGTVVGSPGYMAPEQWSSHGVDARTDVYACGVLLYQLVSGRLPFEDENPFRIATLQISETPAAPHTLNSKVPAALSAIILRALKPAPADRFQSAAAMSDALRAHLLESAICSTLGAALGLDATLPLDLTPEVPVIVGSPFDVTFPGPLTLRLPAPPDNALERTMALPEGFVMPPAAPPLAAFTDGLGDLDDLDGLRGLDQLAAAHVSPALAQPSYSIARNGRPSPLPSVSLARTSSPSLASPALFGTFFGARLRVLLPLAAAFLALGVVLGMILFFPHFHH